MSLVLTSQSVNTRVAQLGEKRSVGVAARTDCYTTRAMGWSKSSFDHDLSISIETRLPAVPVVGLPESSYLPPFSDTVPSVSKMNRMIHVYITGRLQRSTDLLSIGIEPCATEEN